MSTHDPNEPEAEPVQQPTHCPACGGNKLTTTSKAQDRHSYWRCLTCGEVWNLERRAAGSRYSYRR
jgi:transposase-like protein